MVSSRSGLLGEFPAFDELAIVAGTSDAHPFIAADGITLYFASRRTGGEGHHDLYVAKKEANGFQSVRRIEELSGGAQEWLPVTSADQLTIYFGSTRSSGLGETDILVARRSTVTDGWGAAAFLKELNTPRHDAPTYVSADGCSLYFEQDVVGEGDTVQRDLFVAQRPK